MKSHLKNPAQVRVGDHVMLGSTVAEVVGRGRLQAKLAIGNGRGRVREKRTNIALLFLQLASGQLYQQKCGPRERIRVVVKGGAR